MAKKDFDLIRYLVAYGSLDCTNIFTEIQITTPSPTQFNNTSITTRPSTKQLQTQHKMRHNRKHDGKKKICLCRIGKLITVTYRLQDNTWRREGQEG